LATNIYREIIGIRQFNERPLFERMNDLSMSRRVAVTSANAVRYKNSIVIEGDSDELKQIRDKYENVHKIRGKFVDFRKHGGPKGLMFGQSHGKNLFHLGITDRDMSNSGQKRKRDDDHLQPIKKQALSDFYIEGTHIHVLNTDISDKLSDLAIPFSRYDKEVTVDIQYYDVMARYGLLGKAVSKSTPTKPFVSRRFKAFVSHGKSVVVGKRKHIDQIRKKLDINRRIKRGSDDDIDLVVVNNKDRKKAAKVLSFELSGNEPELPTQYLTLLYQLYPSRKPQEDTGNSHHQSI
jgi:hypothetical protein